jgi:molybdopterin synthase sulfur carrier subunit
LELGDVLVEFYGVPRLHAGRADLRVLAGTVAEVLSAVERECPKLSGLVQADGRLAPSFLLSLDGREFLTDLQARISDGERLLLLSAAAGG